MDCLVLPIPSLECGLGRDLISLHPYSSLGSTPVEHYLSIIRSVDSNLQVTIFTRPKISFCPLGVRPRFQKESRTIYFQLHGNTTDDYAF